MVPAAAQSHHYVLLGSGGGWISVPDELRTITQHQTIVEFFISQDGKHIYLTYASARLRIDIARKVVERVSEPDYLQAQLANEAGESGHTLNVSSKTDLQFSSDQETLTRIEAPDGSILCLKKGGTTQLKELKAGLYRTAMTGSAAHLLFPITSRSTN